MKVPEPRKLESGTWFIQLRLNGVSIPVSAASYKECKRQAELIKAEHRAGKRHISAASPGEMTLGEIFDEYLKRKSKSASPSTIRSIYIVRSKRFRTFIDTPLNAVSDWQAVYEDDADHLSAKTLHTQFGYLKTAVKTVCHVTVNDVNELPVVHGEILCLEPDQIEIFTKAVKGDDVEIAALLALSSLRISELTALTWDKVDLKNGRIFVSGASVYNKENKLQDKPTNKNIYSQRYVPVLMKQLQEALERVSEKNGKVVTIHQNTIRRRINDICEQNGLPKVGVHGLRRSFASLAYHLNMPIKIAMSIGGWSDYDTMLKIYTHISQKDVKKYANEMKAFYNKSH